jgi:hypothetical protein
MVAVLFLALLQACQTPQGPKFTEAPAPRADEALVYLYRGNSPPFALSPTIFLESQRIVDLASQGYTQVYVMPGEYATKASWPLISGMPSLTGKLNFAPGRIYFVRLGGDISSASDYATGRPTVITTTTTSLQSVPPSIALRELGACCTFIRPEVERVAR